MPQRGNIKLRTARSSNHFMGGRAQEVSPSNSCSCSSGRCKYSACCCCLPACLVACLMYMQQTVATHFSVSRMETWLNGSHGWLPFWARQRCRCVNSSWLKEAAKNQQQQLKRVPGRGGRPRGSSTTVGRLLRCNCRGEMCHWEGATPLSIGLGLPLTLPI